MTRSDYQVIEFNLLLKKAQKVDSSLNALYNVQKADWNNFIKNLQLNYVSAKIKNANIKSIFKYRKYEKDDYFIAFNDWKCNKWKYFKKTIV